MTVLNPTATPATTASGVPPVKMTKVSFAAKGKLQAPKHDWKALT